MTSLAYWRADAGGPGDDEASVPVPRQADHELGVVVPAVGGVEGGGVREVAVELDPRDPGRGRRTGHAEAAEAGEAIGVGVAGLDGPGSREVCQASSLEPFGPWHGELLHAATVRRASARRPFGCSGRREQSECADHGGDGGDRRRQ